MNKLSLLPLLALLLIATAYADKAYQVNLVVFDSELAFSGVRLIEGEPFAPSTGDKTFTAEVWDQAGVVLATTGFSSSLNGPLEVFIPYQPRGATIAVRDEEQKELFRFTVLPFADTCGDTQCDAQESRETCPRDCPGGGKDDFCDKERDGVCDPDCGSLDEDCDARPVVSTSPLAPPPVKTPTLKKVVSKTPPQQSPAGSMLGMLVGAIALSMAVLTAGGWVIVRKKGQEKKMLRSTIANWMRAGYAPMQIRQALAQKNYPGKVIDSLFEELR